MREACRIAVNDDALVFGFGVSVRAFRVDVSDSLAFAARDGDFIRADGKDDVVAADGCFADCRAADGDCFALCVICDNVIAAARVVKENVRAVAAVKGIVAGVAV